MAESEADTIIRLLREAVEKTSMPANHQIYFAYWADGTVVIRRESPDECSGRINMCAPPPEAYNGMALERSHPAPRCMGFDIEPRRLSEEIEDFLDHIAETAYRPTTTLFGFTVKRHLPVSLCTVLWSVCSGFWLAVGIIWLFPEAKG